MILGIVKFIEQFTKGKYFHDFNVYLNAIKVLNNSSNPYSNIIELPYLYPPIISKLLETSNQSIFSFFYSKKRLKKLLKNKRYLIYFQIIKI